MAPATDETNNLDNWMFPNLNATEILVSRGSEFSLREGFGSSKEV